MSGKEMVSLNIDEKAIFPIIEKQIQAAIVANLGNTTDLVERMVGLALHVKVGVNGNRAKYDSDNKYDFMEAIVGKTIRDAATGAMNDWLAQNSEKIRAAVLKELKKPSRQTTMAKAFADAVESAVRCDFRMSCNVDFKRG